MQIRDALNEIRKDVAKDGLPLLQGYSDGYPGHYGAFILNYPKVYGNASNQDIELMLKDANPSVRLVGAMVTINRGFDPSLFVDLSKDSTPLWVGPFHHASGSFRRMTVSEVLQEMRHDPLFQLRHDLGQSVHLDYIKEKRAGVGAQIVLGKLPDYPFDMARAGIAGDVVARVIFKKDSARPVVQILKSTHHEFEEPTVWSLSNWELKAVSPKETSSSIDTEFECHFVFTIPDD